MEKAVFLDRDGVLNRRIPGDYLQSYTQWEWRPGALAACVTLSQSFDRLIIVTNQQGIGKKLMTVRDLELLHEQMIEEITQAGGRVDGVYFCPHLKEENCGCRKPRPGMIRQALNDFPLIDLSSSYFAGDSYSDLLLANRIRLKTIWVDTKSEDRELIESHLRMKILSVKHRIAELAQLPQLMHKKQ